MEKTSKTSYHSKHILYVFKHVCRGSLSYSLLHTSLHFCKQVMFFVVVKHHRLPTLCPAADLQFASARDYKHRTASIAHSLIIYIKVTNLNRKYI